MLAWLSDCFWHERLWFPEGLGWADLQDRDGRIYAKAHDLWVTIPLALCFLIVRHIFERVVATPLALLLGVRERVRHRATPNPALEAFFCTVTKHPAQAAVQILSKQAGVSVHQVRRWFRRRRNQDRPSKLKKFREASWRFTFYLLAFIAGLVALIDKPWFYDLNEMWKGFPTLTLLPSQYWYYMIELSFYISLLFSVASDVKRKSAKMFNYAGWRKTCNYIFILFAAVFFITRLIILPFRIMYCTWVYPVTIYPPFFGYYFFNGLMLILQCLHIFWAVLILRMAIKFLPGNEIVEDERSDKEETDESEEEEEEEEQGKLENGPVSNGHSALNNNHCKTE
ncbi:ceramide synthase 2-like isoform X2 [Paramormyrops kingsleyae]|uniref:ceramide synthase 2-like isoform X2 n=1 Tax=Paramormyrops kingsleyae TaxID=1676925 RepID=UPI003B96B2E1